MSEPVRKQLLFQLCPPVGLDGILEATPAQTQNVVRISPMGYLRTSGRPSKTNLPCSQPSATTQQDGNQTFGDNHRRTYGAPCRGYLHPPTHV